MHFWNKNEFCEIKNRKKDGSIYWVRSFIKPILDRDRNIVEYIAIRVDISDSKEFSFRENMEEKYIISKGVDSIIEY